MFENYTLSIDFYVKLKSYLFILKLRKWAHKIRSLQETPSRNIPYPASDRNLEI